MENGFYGYTGILNFASDFGIFASENETMISKVNVDF